MEIEDLFRWERIIDVAPSPDGSLIAIVVRRAATSHERYQHSVITEGHADIWLVHPDGTGKRNLTNGVRDASGHWAPTWSPDGEHLAMLSTNGVDDVHARVWSRRTDSLRDVSAGGIDLGANTNPHGGNWSMLPFAWVNRSELAMILPRAGRRSWMAGFVVAGMHTAMAEWPKAERGVEPTVSVLDVGPGIKQPMDTGTVAIVNAVTGRRRIVTPIPMEENSSGSRSLVLSPSRRFAVLLTSERRSIDGSQRRLTRAGARNRIGIVDLDPANPGIRWIDTISAVIDQALEHVIRWSPRDQSVAILAKRTAELDGPSRVYVIRATDGAVRGLLPDDWDTSRIQTTRYGTPVEQAGVAWTNDDNPVVYARQPLHATDGPRAARFDWWLVEPDGTPRNLTASMPAVPPMLSRTQDPRILVGLANGRLWALDVGARTAREVDGGWSHLRSIVWPKRPDLPGATLDRVVVDVGTSLHEELVEVGLGARRGARRIPPVATGSMVGYMPASSLALFTDSTSRVTAARDGQQVELFRINSDVPPIELPAQRLITYRGTDGDTLHAVLILPNGYVPGRRYPMITRVYGGWVFQDTLSLSDRHEEDLLVFAAHGYAVLVPSIPLKPFTVASDTYNDIPKGVLPAVDRAIELGIADPARLGVTGASYGAYATYVLITTTTRFRAAVAEMGTANLVSQYGAFSATNRYSDQAHLVLSSAKMAEDGQNRMGTSPWHDLWQYIRNSPFFYLHRVETPLLIVQSDQDFFGMSEGEGVFTAMQRLGKRAQLVRYWGEWHGLESPANIRDYWRRTLAWFDQYLASPERQAVR